MTAPAHDPCNLCGLRSPLLHVTTTYGDICEDCFADECPDNCMPDDAEGSDDPELGRHAHRRSLR